MSLWLFIWILISGALLFFLGWTLYILYQQKKGWRSFAEANDLRYFSTSLMNPPNVEGVYKGYSLQIFASEHTRPGARTSRKLTAIEITIEPDLSFAGSVASGGLVDVLQDIGYQHEIKPAYKKWPKSCVAAADDKVAMASYLTDERCKAILSLVAIKDAWCIYGFTNELSILRIDTPHPLVNAKVLEETLQKMIKVAKALRLKDGEGKDIKDIQVKEASKSVVLEESSAEDISGLELDED